MQNGSANLLFPDDPTQAPQPIPSGTGPAHALQVIKDIEPPGFWPLAACRVPTRDAASPVTKACTSILHGQGLATWGAGYTGLPSLGLRQRHTQLGKDGLNPFYVTTMDDITTTEDVLQAHCQQYPQQLNQAGWRFVNVRDAEGKIHLDHEVIQTAMAMIALGDTALGPRRQVRCMAPDLATSLKLPTPCFDQCPNWLPTTTIKVIDDPSALPDDIALLETDSDTFVDIGSDRIRSLLDNGTTICIYEVGFREAFLSELAEDPKLKDLIDTSVATAMYDAGDQAEAWPLALYRTDGHPLIVLMPTAPKPGPPILQRSMQRVMQALRPTRSSWQPVQAGASDEAIEVEAPTAVPDGADEELDEEAVDDALSGL